MSFVKEAWPFVLPFALLSALLFVLGQPRWGAAAAVVGLLVLLFFRDPRRRFDGDDRIVVAPASGKITAVSLVEDPQVGPGRFHRVVTFLSVFDVHVQRCPVDGQVALSQPRRGLKLAAFRPDVGERNQAHTNVFVRPDGDRIGVRQLAGLLARRVVSYVGVGDSKSRGERLGVIKFGSRVDLFVPESYRVLVVVGDRVRDGETPMAEPGERPTVTLAERPQAESIDAPTAAPPSRPAEAPAAEPDDGR